MAIPEVNTNINSIPLSDINKETELKKQISTGLIAARARIVRERETENNN